MKTEDLKPGDVTAMTERAVVLLTRIILPVVGALFAVLAIFEETEGGWTWPVTMGFLAICCIALVLKLKR